MDTEGQGHCFFCLGKVRSTTSTTTTVSSPATAKRGKWSCSSMSVYSLRCLSRYLGMDVRKVLSQNERDGPVQQRSKITVALCGGCSPLGEEFSSLYQQLELLEMKVQSCLKMIQGKLLEAVERGNGDDEANGLSFGKQNVPKILEELRNEARVKCFQKLSNIFPLVSVPRMTKRKLEDEKLQRVHHNSAKALETDGVTVKLEVDSVLENDLNNSNSTPEGLDYRNKDHLLHETESEAIQAKRKPPKIIGGTQKAKKKFSENDDYSTDDSETESEKMKIKRKPPKIIGTQIKGKKKFTKKTPILKPGSGPGKIRTRPWSRDPETGHFKCTLCSQQFPYYNKFYQHHNLVHLQIKHKCGLCSATFQNKPNYERHIRTVHMGLTYMCDICCTTFTDANNLRTHQLKAKCGPDYVAKRGRTRIRDMERPTSEDREQISSNPESAQRSGFMDHQTGNMCLASGGDPGEVERSKVEETAAVAVVAVQDVKLENDKPFGLEGGFFDFDQSYSPPSSGSPAASLLDHLLEDADSEAAQKMNVQGEGKNDAEEDDQPETEPLEADDDDNNGYRIRPKRSTRLKVKSQVLSSTLSNDDDLSSENEETENPSMDAFGDVHNSSDDSNQPPDDQDDQDNQTDGVSQPSSSNQRNYSFDPLTRLYKCAVCPQQFRTYNAYYDHYDRLHGEGTPLKCDLCPRVFTWKKYYRLHRRRMHPGADNPPPAPPTYSCVKCLQSFSLKKNLKQHRLHDCPFKRVKKVKPPKTKKKGDGVECRLCSKKFPTKILLFKHHRSDHEDDRYMCDLCGLEYSKEQLLRNHQAKVHANLSLLPCPHCKERFRARTKLLKHLREAECGMKARAANGGNVLLLVASSDRPETCNICNRKFSSREQLDQHFNEEHPSLEGSRCTDCGKGYLSKKKLGYHKCPLRAIVEDEGDDNNGTPEGDGEEDEAGDWKDQISNPGGAAASSSRVLVGADAVMEIDLGDPTVGKCSYEEVYPPEVSTEDGLHLPEPEASPANFSRYKCPLCPVLFRTILSFRNHYKSTHLKVKYRCTYNNCGKLFTLPTSCQRHHVEDHVGERIKCPVCKFPFKCRGEVYRHLKKTSCGEGKPPPPKQLYNDIICHVCGTGFKDRYRLDIHLRHVHSDVRDRLCDICGKGFKTDQGVRMHLKRIHPETCPIKEDVDGEDEGREPSSLAEAVEDT